MEYDVLIVGQGPAAVSAALYIRRAGLTAALLGRGPGSLAKAERIENYYGLARPLSGLELHEVGRAQARALGAELIDAEVVSVEWDGLYRADAEGQRFSGRALIMAPGARRASRPIEGLAALEGHGVSYCAVCDAFFYRGKDVAVLGSGEYALHEANELLATSGSVTLLSDGQNLTAEFPPEIRVDTRKIATLLGKDSLEGLRFEDGSSLAVAGLFVALGSAGAVELARKLGAPIENGSIVVDSDMSTGLPGLFAAGDCTGGLAQVAAAVGQGALAGLSAIKFVRQSSKGANS